MVLAEDLFCPMTITSHIHNHSRYHFSAGETLLHINELLTRNELDTKFQDTRHLKPALEKYLA